MIGTGGTGPGFPMEREESLSGGYTASRQIDVEVPALETADANTLHFTVVVPAIRDTIGSCDQKIRLNERLPAGAWNEGPVCDGNDIHLHVTGVPGAGFSWTGPNGFTSFASDPVIYRAQSIHGGGRVQPRH